MTLVPHATGRVEVVECYPSPANGGRLRPVPVLWGPDGHGGECILPPEEQPTAWHRLDPDVQRTLDWLNGYGHHDSDEAPHQNRVHFQ